METLKHIIPYDESKQDYINDAILLFWIWKFDVPDNPHLSRINMLIALAHAIDASIDVALLCACAFKAGRVSVR